MVASVPIEANVTTAEWNDPDPSGPDPLPEKLAQNGNVLGSAGGVGGQVPLHLGAASGAMPKAGFSSLVKAVGRPESWLTRVADPVTNGGNPKYAGSLPSVTSSGTCTCKIKCALGEFGDGAKDTLTPMLS